MSNVYNYQDLRPRFLQLIQFLYYQYNVKNDTSLRGGIYGPEPCGGNNFPSL